MSIKYPAITCLVYKSCDYSSIEQYSRIKKVSYICYFYIHFSIKPCIYIYPGGGDDVLEGSNRTRIRCVGNSMEITSLNSLVYCRADTSIAVQGGGGCDWFGSSRRACQIAWAIPYQGTHCLWPQVLSLLVHVPGCIRYLCPYLMEITAQVVLLSFFFM